MRPHRKYTGMTNKENILALSMIKGVGANFIKKNLSLISAYENNLEMLAGMGGKINMEEITANLPAARSMLQRCEALNIQAISILDSNYPSKLKELKDPPPFLYCLGNLALLHQNTIAIIGTRKSTELGDQIACRIGSYFTQNYSICNGLVEGIDKSSIYNGKDVFPNVIGILSGGLNFGNTSSKITIELAEKVLDNNGLLISEYEPDQKETQFSGSKASRIQAGISNALILIQSKKDGGSKYTLKAFSELSRPLGIVDFKDNQEFQISENFSGNRLLLEKGLEGIAEMCDIKKKETIRISKLIKISQKSDYINFEKEISMK